MKHCCWVPTVLALALPMASAMASATAKDAAGEGVDLSKIERSIAKEPKYAAGAQEYGLLVFGRKADTRVWLVRDGDVLYVDRNGNGDLTEPDEVVRGQSSWSCGEIASRGGKKYRSLSVSSLSGSGYRLRVEVPEMSFQIVGITPEARPRFASRAKDAPIIHFDGPLALTQFSTKRVIPRDNGPTNIRNRSLRVMIGTPGLGEGTFAAYPCRVCEKQDRGPMLGKFVYSTSGGSQIEVTEPLEKIG